MAVCENSGQDICVVQACLEVQKAVLFTGTTGVGKSVIVSGALERLRGTKTVVPYTVNFSAQTQAMDSQVGSQPILVQLPYASFDVLADDNPGIQVGTVCSAPLMICLPYVTHKHD